MDLASFVISSVFYVVLYGTGAGLIKSPLFLNLDVFRLFVCLSVVCERLLEGTLFSFLLFVLFCLEGTLFSFLLFVLFCLVCLYLLIAFCRLRLLFCLFEPSWEGSWRVFVSILRLIFCLLMQFVPSSFNHLALS